MVVQVHNMRYGLGSLLADDMGLGKTIQTIAGFLFYKEAGKVNAPVLVIAPLSLLAGWQKEIKKWAPRLRVSVTESVRAIARSVTIQ